MDATTAPAPAMTLRLVRQTAGDPASTSHEVQVADRADAHRHLSWLTDDVDAITAYLTDAAGRYCGTGVAGGGRCLSDWA